MYIVESKTTINGTTYTVREGIDELSVLTYDKVELMRVLFGKIPRHRKLGEKLL